MATKQQRIHVRYPGTAYAVPINPKQHAPLNPHQLNKTQTPTVGGAARRNPNQKGA